MKLSNALMTNAIIVIDDERDMMQACKLVKCEIESRIQTLYTQCVINSEQKIHAVQWNDNRRFAKVDACILDNCSGLEGGFHSCRINVTSPGKRR